MNMKTQSDLTEKEINFLKNDNVFKKIIDSKLFAIMSIILILLNSIVLSLDNYNNSKSFDKWLRYLNWIFGVLFVIEMILKILAIGIKAYTRDSFNIFDTALNLISLIDIIISIRN